MKIIVSCPEAPIHLLINCYLRKPLYFHQHGISLISDPQHWLHFFLREFMTVPLQLKQEGAKIDCLTTANIVDGKKGQFTYIKGAQIYIFK